MTHQKMTFGGAISTMKTGSLIQRAGWNGKGMYVYLTTREGLAPCMTLHPPSGPDQPGWNASTPDVLAEDWQVVADAGTEPSPA